MKKSFSLGSGNSMYSAVIRGMVLGAALTIVAICMFSFLLTIKDFDESVARPLALISATVGSFVSGFAAAKTFKQNGLLIGAVTGFLLLLVFTLLSLVITKTGLTSIFFIRMILMICASSVGGVIGVNRVQKRKIV